MSGTGLLKEDLAPVLMQSLNWALRYTKLRPSWKETLISVIPKEGKNKELCKTYQPISILT